MKHKIYEQKIQGDILIFVPGINEIRTMKELVLDIGVDEENIVEVHSSLS